MASFSKRIGKPVRTVPVCLFTFAFACLAAAARKATVRDATSEEYLNSQPGVAYVGDEACQECHQSQYRDFKKTGMGRSLSIPGPGNWPEFTKPVTLSNKKLDPYDTPAYFGLAERYSSTLDEQSATETLKNILKYDPGNEEARRALADAKGSGER